MPKPDRGRSNIRLDVKAGGTDFAAAEPAAPFIHQERGRAQDFIVGQAIRAAFEFPDFSVAVIEGKPAAGARPIHSFAVRHSLLPPDKAGINLPGTGWSCVERCDELWTATGKGRQK